MLFVGTVGFSQIKIIKPEEPILIGKVGAFGAPNFTCKKDVKNNTYIFTYIDLNFRKTDVYKSFKFKDIDNAFDNLYKLLMDGLKNKPKEDITIELAEGEYIKLHFVSAFGVVNVNISSYKNGVSGTSVWLTKRKVKKLFGK